MKSARKRSDDESSPNILNQASARKKSDDQTLESNEDFEFPGKNEGP
jgi:hypothetical protein